MLNTKLRIESINQYNSIQYGIQILTYLKIIIMYMNNQKPTVAAPRGQPQLEALLPPYPSQEQTRKKSAYLTIFLKTNFAPSLPAQQNFWCRHC